ncbi:MAG: alpha/beta hydrolase [Actinomycetales bacterium]|nr:MAG: alpha/beta hydrolase [Actinomycetales bacterium]
MNIVERGSGRPVVLVHGFPVDHRSMLPLDGWLDEPGAWRRIYVDLPFVRGSDSSRAIESSDDVLAELVDTLDRLIGPDESYLVVGSSFGGLLSSRIAHDDPRVVGLALLEPAVIADHARRDVPPHVVLHEDPDALAAVDPALAQEYAEMSVVQSAEGLQVFAESVHAGLEAADPTVVARVEQKYSLSGGEAELGYDGPTLVVTGRQDHVVGYQDQLDLLDRYPRATFALLDSAGHNAHLERPDVVGALLRDWLVRVGAASD